MNKEQFRKELEDATEWGFNHNWINFKTWASDRDTYITTRLAAIDDGDWKENFKEWYYATEEERSDMVSAEQCVEWLEKNILGQNTKPLDDGQEGKGQAEDYLKASVGKVLNIDFSKEQWYIDWWMLLDPQPSFRCIIRAMEAYKAALPVADGEGQKVGSDCSNHKKDLFGQTDMKVVAESIGDLHYKTLSQLFFELQTKFHNDAMNDLKGEKFKVAHHLGRISNHQFEASIDAESLWLICKPFMEPKCPRCKGDGIVEKNVKGFEGEPEYDTEVECPECGGSGKENNE